MKKFVGWHADAATETARAQERYACNMRALARVRRERQRELNETITCRCTLATIVEFGASR